MIPIFNEQADWDGNSELSVAIGREISHTGPEDLRKLMYLLWWYQTDATKINNYKDNRRFYAIDTGESDVMEYMAKPTTGWWSTHSSAPAWVRQSLHGQPFQGNSTAAGYRGGTVYYENNYRHTCSFATGIDGHDGEVGIILGVGSEFLGSSRTDTSVSASDAYSVYNRFRDNTPVVIVSSVNNISGRVTRDEVNGIKYLFLTPSNPNQPLIYDPSNGYIECWFGGDYYMTNTNFTWEESHFDSGDRTWNMNGTDSRPPDGGFLSENNNGWWCRTVNPYLYHHWDQNSNRWIGIFLSNNDATDTESLLIPSADYFPIQLDPKEQSVPTWYIENSRGEFNYEPVELKAAQITDTSTLGPLKPMQYKYWQQGGYNYYLYSTGDDQYMDMEIVQVSTAAFGKRLASGPGDDVTLEITPYTGVDGNPFYIGADKLNSTAYQNCAEFYCSAFPYMTFVPDSGGNSRSSDFRRLWNDHYRNEDPFYSFGNSLADTLSFKSNFPNSNSDFFDCNGSTFEGALSGTGDYDWYLDTSTPYVPQTVAAIRASCYDTNGNPRTGTYDPDLRAPIAPYTWRKTWKYSCGRKSQFMTSGTPTPAIIYDSSNPTPYTPDDWGICFYPNSYITAEEAAESNFTQPTYAATWIGRYCGGKPKASCFRTDYRTIVSRSGNVLELDSSVNLPEGAMVQFYSSDGDIDDYVTQLYVKSCNGVYVTFFDTPPASGIMQWDSNIIARHDPIQIVDGTPKYKVSPLLLHHIREVLRQMEYRRIDSPGMELAVFVGGTISGWTGVNEGDPYPTRDAALSAAEAYLAEELPWPPKDDEGNYLKDTKYPVGFERWYWRSYVTGILQSSKSAFYDHYYPEPKWAGSASILSLAFKLTQTETIPESAKIIISLSYAYPDVYDLYDSSWSLPGVVEGVEGITFNVKGKSFGLPDPTLKSLFDGYYKCELNDTPENQAATRYGWIEATFSDGWHQFNFSKAVGTGIDNTHEPEIHQSRFGYKRLDVGINTSADIGVEIDPNTYTEAIWARDYTYAYFYYDTLEENNPPWPNPAQFVVNPILKGYTEYPDTFELNGCVSDTDENYFIVNGNLPDDINEIQIEANTSGTANWDGTYTFVSKESVPTYNTFGAGNGRRWKVTVEEDIPYPSYDVETNLGTVTILSHWYIEATVKLCEDWEGDDPVEYKLYPSFITGSGYLYYTNWQEEREFIIPIGDTATLLTRLNINNFKNLAYRAAAKDSLGLETKTTSEIVQIDLDGRVEQDSSGEWVLVE